MLFNIPHQKLREGAKLCLDNSIMLFECANYIIDKFPSVAAFLVIFALEEVGKGITFMRNYESNNDLTKKDWKELKDHINKIEIVYRALVDPYSVLKPHDLSVRLSEYKEFNDLVNKIASELHILRLNYLFVNWDEKEGKWNSPVYWDEDKGNYIYRKEEFVERLLKQFNLTTMLLGEKLRE